MGLDLCAVLFKCMHGKADFLVGIIIYNTGKCKSNNNHKHRMTSMEYVQFIL